MFVFCVAFNLGVFVGAIILWATGIGNNQFLMSFVVIVFIGSIIILVIDNEIRQLNKMDSIQRRSRIMFLIKIGERILELVLILLVLEIIREVVVWRGTKTFEISSVVAQNTTMYR